ncbi:MAG: hypothetical protein KKD56_00115, partial [Acidobacteria bacterium]|nr:hypothetical protein [Acidobacteriota bacterium]
MSEYSKIHFSDSHTKPEISRFKKGYKPIAVLLSALLLSPGLAFGAEKKPTQRSQPDPIEEKFSLVKNSESSALVFDSSSVQPEKKINLTAKAPTKDELYEHYFKH